MSRSIRLAVLTVLFAALAGCTSSERAGMVKTAEEVVLIGFVSFLLVVLTLGGLVYWMVNSEPSTDNRGDGGSGPGGSPQYRSVKHHSARQSLERTEGYLYKAMARGDDVGVRILRNSCEHYRREMDRHKPI